MKKTIILALAALSYVHPGYTQFSQAVKDSVLHLLAYPTAAYTVSLNYKPEVYAIADDNPDLQKLTRQQLIDKKKGDYTDASVYKALAAKSWYEDNNQQEAAQYLTEAGQKYQQWINAEPGNTTPINELLNMCISSQNYPLIPGVLDYALPLFPKNLPLLHNAIYYEQYVAKRYDRSRELINQALSVDSFHLTSLSYLSGLLAIQQMEAMQQKKPIVFTEIPGLREAMTTQPQNIGLRHFYYYHQLFYLYIKVAAHAMNDESGSTKLFDLYTLTPQEDMQLKEIEQWMMQQAALKGKNEAQMLNSLAVIKCMYKDYSAASAYFDKSYQLSNESTALESRIMCQMFMDAYPEVEKLLQQKIATNNSLQDYGSLLMLCSKYTKNSTLELALLKKLETIPVKNPLAYQLLATGYLKTNQPEPLPGVLSMLGDTDRDHIMIKLVAAIIHNKRSSAAVYINNLLHLKPDDEDGLVIKKLTGL
jgi:hypothetical protein